MHILYIHQYFASRRGRTGTRSYEFGRYLAGRGHHVTMITSGVANEEFPVAEGKLYSEHEIDGIRVVSVAAAYNDPHVGTATPGWRRMLKFYQFARTASRVGKNLDKPDVVFATHTPLTAGLAGEALARHFGVSFVFCRTILDTGFISAQYQHLPRREIRFFEYRRFAGNEQYLYRFKYVP